MIHLPEIQVRHCCNCNKSTATGKMDQPLTCSSRVAKNLFSNSAGSDECAQTCPAFKWHTTFNTAGLRK